jgi:hypothetical protein
MKRLFYTIACTLMCTFCGPYVQEAAAQTYESHLRSTTHEERAERRAKLLAEDAKLIDSIVLSHNFEFNPQSIQMQPAGQMRFLSNAVYTMTLWDGQLDICMPYYVGYVPPYRYVLLNTGVPSVEDYSAVRTEEGWHITFKTTLYASSDYTFSLDVNHRYGGATLTIDNLWYNPVQYTGSITRIY